MVGAKRWRKESWLGFSTTQLSPDNFLLAVHPTTCQPTNMMMMVVMLMRIIAGLQSTFSNDDQSKKLQG